MRLFGLLGHLFQKEKQINDFILTDYVILQQHLGSWKGNCLRRLINLLLIIILNRFPEKAKVIGSIAKFVLVFVLFSRI